MIDMRSFVSLSASYISAKITWTYERVYRDISLCVVCTIHIV